MSKTEQLDRTEAPGQVGDPWVGPGDGANGSAVAAVAMVVLLVALGPWIGIDWRLVALFVTIGVLSVVIRLGLRRPSDSVQAPESDAVDAVDEGQPRYK